MNKEGYAFHDCFFTASAVIYALWGKEAITAKGAKLIKAASADKKPLYEKIFAEWKQKI